MTEPKLMISELTNTIYIVWGRDNKVDVTDKAIDFARYVLKEREKHSSAAMQIE